MLLVMTALPATAQQQSQMQRQIQQQMQQRREHLNQMNGPLAEAVQSMERLTQQLRQQFASSGGQGMGRRRGDGPIVLPDTATYADVGIGDPSLRADVMLRSGLHGGPGIRLAGSIKAPVADVDRGFGTGAWDGALGLLASVTGYTAAIVKDTDPPLQAATGASYAFGNGRHGLNASAAVGLPEPTPDASFGLGWRVAL